MLCSYPLIDKINRLSQYTLLGAIQIIRDTLGGGGQKSVTYYLNDPLGQSPVQDLWWLCAVLQQSHLDCASPLKRGPAWLDFQRRQSLSGTFEAWNKTLVAQFFLTVLRKEKFRRFSIFYFEMAINFS